MRNYNKIFVCFALLSISYLLFSASFASAHSGGLWGPGDPLVPCGVKDSSGVSMPCTRCELFHLVKHLIDFVLVLVIPFGATFLFIYAGVLYILAGANPGLQAKAKNIFVNTIYGIIVVLLPWLITNTVIVNLGDNIPGGAWYSFTCTEPVEQPPIPVPSTVSLPPSTANPLCLTPAGIQTLANMYKEPYPAVQNAPSLDTLIKCIEADPTLKGINLGSKYTTDVSHPLCNFTRGNNICYPGGSCSHSVNSCHYGGATGTQGALAVDYGNQLAGNLIITAAQKCGAKSARCENSKGQTVACLGAGANHVHITAAGCDKN